MLSERRKYRVFPQRKYINLRYPSNSNQIGFPLFGFDDQIGWMKGDISKINYVNDSSWWLNIMDFERIMKDLYAAGLITAGLVARKNGQILYISENWIAESEDVRKCLNAWQSRAQFITFQNVKYSILFSQPEHFSAVNSKEKVWLVGAVSPEENGERYYVLGLTAPEIDGKNAYIEVARAAYKMREEGSSKTAAVTFKNIPQLIKAEQDIMAALEKQLGSPIPSVNRVDYNTFGFVTKDKHIIAIGFYDKDLVTLPECFWSLKSLQTLSLFRNKFKSLPESIGDLNKLETLWLQENKLENLPLNIGKLSSLQILNLWNNKLSALPESIGELSVLKTAHLYNNVLTSLPENIGNLKSLKELYAYSNKLTTVPLSIGNLKSLQILDLRYNSLNSLPDSIGNLSSLIMLLLVNNQLPSLPESIGNLSALQKLNISDNWISKLPDSIIKLTALKELCMISNPLPSKFNENIGKFLEKQGFNLDVDVGPHTPSYKAQEIIQIWATLSKTTWDEKKKEKILDRMKSGGNDIFSLEEIRDIRYQMVQSSIEYDNITKWKSIDEGKEPDLSLKSLNEIHERMQSKKDILHPSIWVYLEESIKTKSKKFQQNIAFSYK
jgi:Leucine-rich repeat (LRR) protein